jgi:hypothetical protein
MRRVDLRRWQVLDCGRGAVDMSKPHVLPTPYTNHYHSFSTETPQQLRLLHMPCSHPYLPAMQDIRHMHAIGRAQTGVAEAHET